MSAVAGEARGRVSVPLYTGALAAAAVGCAAAGRGTGGTGSMEWPVVLGFLAFLTAAEYMIVRFRYRGEIVGLNLFESALAPLLLAATSPLVVALVAAAEVLSGLLHRDPPRKAAFNVAQWALAAGAGSLVYRRLGGGEVLDAPSLRALIAAVTAVALLNMLAFAGVMRLASGDRLRTVLPGIAPSIALGWAVNAAIGVLFAAAFDRSPASMILFAVPLVLLHAAQSGYGAVLAERARATALHRATAALSRPIDPEEALPSFLDEVRDALAARAVELALADGDGFAVHQVRADRAYSLARFAAEGSVVAAVIARGTPIVVADDDPDEAVASLLRRAGWRTCVAAPLVSEGRAIGALCAFDRTGPETFAEADVAMLAALAAEATGMIEKGALLRRLLGERTKMSEIVERASDGIVTLDAAGTVLTWNAGMAAITGLPADETLGRRWPSSLHARDAGGTPAPLWAWSAVEARLPEDILVRGAGGEERWLSCAYSAVPGDDGRPHTLVVIARDVTAVRDVERMREDFVATVSHELRTPLTPIKGWAQTMLRSGEALSQEQRMEASRAILRQAEILERILLNLLDVSRIERGVIDLRETETDVRAVVRRIVEEHAVSSPDRAIRVEFGRGPARVHGDEVCIGRIVSNLVGNALKYAPPEEAVDVAIHEEDGSVIVEVADRGAGIPSSERERIFERFRRIADDGRPQAGTGLGLYISRQLAAIVGATIAVEAREGGGSVFRLTLRPVRRLVAVG